MVDISFLSNAVKRLDNFITWILFYIMFDRILR